MRFIKSLTLFAFSMLIAFGVCATQPKVSIIIDDMGYRLSDQLAFELPAHIAFAILPHTEQSERFSQTAHQQGRTVILHLPMETQQPKALGPGALLASMSAEAIADTLDQALATVPNAVGVNNHMGSKLTQLTFPMTTLMNALSERQLFFIDSRTTRFTKAHKIAAQTGVPVLQRKVFLDHELTEKFIIKQFQHLIKLSEKHGQAIGIAHPHPLTIEVLKQLVEQESAVNFVTVTDLFSKSEADSFVQLNQQPRASESNPHPLFSESAPAN